jgi:hypothetical protein
MGWEVIYRSEDGHNGATVLTETHGTLAQAQFRMVDLFAFDLNVSADEVLETLEGDGEYENGRSLCRENQAFIHEGGLTATIDILRKE